MLEDRYEGVEVSLLQLEVLERPNTEWYLLLLLPTEVQYTWEQFSRLKGKNPSYTYWRA